MIERAGARDPAPMKQLPPLVCSSACGSVDPMPTRPVSRMVTFVSIVAPEATPIFKPLPEATRLSRKVSPTDTSVRIRALCLVFVNSSPAMTAELPLTKTVPLTVNFSLGLALLMPTFC